MLAVAALALASLVAPQTEYRTVPGDRTIIAEATGSVDADGDPIKYVYEWWYSKDNGATWTRWGSGRLLSALRTAKGDLWYARAYATDGEGRSPWFPSEIVRIGGSSPTPPGNVILKVGRA